MVVYESIFRDILRLIVWYPLRAAVLFLPYRMGIYLLRLMGDLHFMVAVKRRQLLSENLSLICPAEKNKSPIIREYFRNHYIDRLIILIFPSLSPNEFKKTIEFHGLEYLNAALSKGRGAILVHGHFGPVHLPLVAIARLGYRTKQIGLPSDEGLSWIGRNVAFRLRMKYESMIPAEIIKADSFLRGAFRWLNDNGIIMTTGDGSGTERHLGRHEVFSLFGHPVMFPLGPAILSQKTGAVIIPMFITPGENGYLYKIIIEKPLASDQTGREAIFDITEQFVRRLETYISIYPGYMHFLDRFCPKELMIAD